DARPRGLAAADRGQGHARSPGRRAGPGHLDPRTRRSGQADQRPARRVVTSVRRRTLLALAGTAPAAAALGCHRTPPQRAGELVCAPKSTMTEVSQLGGRPLVYEVNGRPGRFPIEPTFLGLLERWQQYWLDHSGLPAHDQVWTYGAWVDGEECTSWHGAGRAFDISRLRRDGVPIVSCREDLWSVMDDVALRDQHRRRYWAMAASLHLH